MIGSIVTLIFIGIVIGWIYKGFTGKGGPAMTYCMLFATIGSLSGGLIFLFAGLGGELVVGLLAAILVSIAADVLSREVVHE